MKDMIIDIRIDSITQNNLRKRKTKAIIIDMRIQTQNYLSTLFVDNEIIKTSVKFYAKCMIRKLGENINNWV